MLDLTSDKGKLIAAALELAAERPWAEITLADISHRANTTLMALKQLVSTKGDILSEFVRLVDDRVLADAPPRSADQPARDALFEIVMSRFDTLAPYKPALKSIAAGAPDLAQIGPVLASQRWMLEAAGIGTDGLGGAARTAGLLSVYASVFRTWLADDDPGHARTMAALDRRLRRGERTLQQVEGVCSGIGRVAGAFRDAFRAARRPAQTQQSAPPAPHDPAPPQPYA